MNEIEAVRNLGQQIGYGNLMTLASAIWRENLDLKGYPLSGAFVPVTKEMVLKKYHKDIDSENKAFDIYIKK